ncbi:cobalamin adenosyltransferase [Lutispora thermophila]|uniref:Ethanolamine utilization cobalamin adenosyltransferase n=1 Tax=Lutispora thermophila DSM 19022 TaxID=1122184 RepID=A0A1M6FIW0_9FIRM|nr:cobalamin adenosyltransferase [Lutispora thermophila]SHI97637.1 ethanolamine utilization cobalamin adenosyltransferase [Lutispora thermophila DSM 19022]
MSVLTEASLRAELKNKKISQYIVGPDIKVTPSARQYLKERDIELIIKDKDEKTEEVPKKDEIKVDERECLKPKYYAAYGGGYFADKPEYMTQLYGNKLVFKDHPHIVLRGKLDSLQSKIMEVQLAASKHKSMALVKDLDEVLILCRNIMRAEVLNEPLEDIKVLELGEKELREMSHNPQKYFNTKHMLPSWEMGELAVLLNSIRSTIRETEIAAIKAFKTEDGVNRIDIIKALNRLSSCLYIMLLRQLTGYYKEER